MHATGRAPQSDTREIRLLTAVGHGDEISREDA